ncbi:MAG: bestrophin family ion channel, partial [Flavitalea sp.]
LAFRTSQSYERWWEARTVWGAIVNDSRTLIRQLIEFLPNDENKEAVLRQFAERQSIWCYALAESLRRLPFSEKTQTYCEANKVHGQNLPNILLNHHAYQLAEICSDSQLNANKQVQIDNTLQRLTDSMGKCERIKTTVFPRSYSVLIHFLIYALMTILPFGLEDNHAIVEVALVFFVPSLFIAIEQTAILMQDPFENKPNDTAMTTISNTIERNLAEMIGEQVVPAKTATNETFYIL